MLTCGVLRASVLIWEIPGKTRISSRLTLKWQNNFSISAVEPREMSIPRLQGVLKVCSNSHPSATMQGSCWLACSRDAQVSPVQSVKNLGTWIDSNMSLQVNINNTCKAAYYYITNVRRIRKYLSNQATQTLVHALIIGRIDYCNSILYGLPAKQIAKLQRLQNSELSTRVQSHILPGEA